MRKDTNQTSIALVQGLGLTGLGYRSRFGPTYKICCSFTQKRLFLVLIAGIDAEDPIESIYSINVCKWTGFGVGPSSGPEIGPTVGPR